MAAFKLGFRCSYLRPSLRIPRIAGHVPVFYGAGRAAIVDLLAFLCQQEPVLFRVPNLICYELIDFVSATLPEIEIEFYNLHEDLTPDLASLGLSDRRRHVTLLVDYFGSVGLMKLVRLAESLQGDIVFDCVHSFTNGSPLPAMQPRHHLVVGFRKIFFPLIGALLISPLNAELTSFWPQRLFTSRIRRSVRETLWSLRYGTLVCWLTGHILNWSRLSQDVRAFGPCGESLSCPVRIEILPKSSADREGIGSWPTFPSMLEGEARLHADALRQRLRIIPAKI